MLAAIAFLLLLLRSTNTNAHRLHAHSNAEQYAGSRPNFVILFCDDWGWGDLGANWNRTQETPNMDALAQHGMRFTDMHAMSVCTPSRASLLTGRLGLRTGVIANFQEDSLHGLPLSELTLAELLKSVNYSTMAIGKWHLGHQREYHPTNRGFDAYVGLPYSVDMGCVDCYNVNIPEERPCPYDPHLQIDEPALPLYDSRSSNCSNRASCDETIIAQPADLTTLASLYATAAHDFIFKHARGKPLAGHPFFLYMPFSHVHVPLSHDPRFAHKSARNNTFGDTLLELDHTIGSVVRSLQDAGVANDTLIVLAGDNGPWEVKCDLAGSTGIYTGGYQKRLGGGSTGKLTTWEGGHRVPGVAAWPNHIREGAVSTALVSTLDIVPTFAALAGARLPSDRVFDGVDISAILFDNHSVAPNRTYLFHPGVAAGYMGILEAARYGKYKAHFATYSVEGCNESYTQRIVHDPPLIFDLERDPSESHPLLAPSLQLVSSFKRALQDIMSDITGSFRSFANYTGGGFPAWPCCNPSNVGCRCFN